MPKLVIHVPEDLDITFDEDDETNCEIEVKQASTGGMTSFDVTPPTFQQRIVIMKSGLVDEVTTDVVLSGITKPFINGFHNLQMKDKSPRMNTMSFSEYMKTSSWRIEMPW